MAMLLFQLLAVGCLFVTSGLAQRGDTDMVTQLTELRSMLWELKNETQDQAAELSTLKDRLTAAEKELHKDTPKVAFTVSLGGNGLVTTTYGKRLIYRTVLTNVGSAYNSENGVFTAPVKGVYYFRFTANSPTEGVMSSVLYKEGRVLLIVHEQPSGEGSDTASNGGSFLLEKGDEIYMQLWANTQVWDNSNHHSTFSGFLLYPM